MNPSRVLARCFLVTGLFVCMASVASAQGNVSASPTAKEHFAVGVAHIEDPSGPKYEEAYREFKAAYADSPIHTIALNVGYAAFFLERDLEALEMYELYLAKAGPSEIPKAQRAQLEKDVRALKAGLVRVSLRVTQAKAILVDERIPTKGSPVTNRYPIENGVAQLGIHPGSHRMTIIADGYQTQSWEFEAQPGSSHSHVFDLTPLAAEAAAQVSTRTNAPDDLRSSNAPETLDDDSPSRTVPVAVYVGAASTAVFAAGAITMGVFAKSKRNEFDSINDGTQVARAQHLNSDTKRYLLAADICLGITLLSAGVTAYYYLTAPSSPPGRSSKTSWGITPSIGQQRADVTLTSSF